MGELYRLVGRGVTNPIPANPSDIMLNMLKVIPAAHLFDAIKLMYSNPPRISTGADLVMYFLMGINKNSFLDYVKVQRTF